MELTNYELLWRGLGSPSNVAVWLVYHNVYKNRPTLEQIRSLDADKIFVVDQEGLCADWVDADERIYVWDSTYRKHPRFFPYFWWWDTTHDVARDQQLLEKLNPKPQYHFEAMLGYQKPTADIVYKNFKDDSRVLLNYFYKSNVWLPSGNAAADGVFTGTSGELVEYNSDKQQANRSTFIPTAIYNQSWFSVVTESRPSDIFFTEKTAKPLLSKRLFVFFGAKHSLWVLHQLGFKTFSSVIDESYDSIEDDQQRWQAAADQIKFLLEQDPGAVYQQILPVLEYNQQLFQSINWNNQMEEQMKRLK